MKIFEFQKLIAMHHNIIGIQVLDRVYNVSLPASDFYNLSHQKPGMWHYIACLEPEQNIVLTLTVDTQLS